MQPLPAACRERSRDFRKIEYRLPFNGERAVEKCFTEPSWESFAVKDLSFEFS